jgi:hypothetical protein
MTFFIVDVLCWNARVFYDLEAAGRQIWAKSRVHEDGPFGTPVECAAPGHP